MCAPCRFTCCDCGIATGCGCDDCPDPRCQDRRADDRPHPSPVNDDDPLDMPAPIAAAARAAARFRCLEIA